MKKRTARQESKHAGAKRRRQDAARARRGTEARPADALRWGAMLLTGSFAIAQVPVYAAGALPVACPGSGAACIGGTGKSLGFDQLGTGSTITAGASRLQINQNANAAIFNWASFNISTGNTVQFIQPSSSSVALNRIFDPNVTTISGKLIANGQIYLINPNGILFGSGANVNVAGLIASTSNITDKRITAGLLSDTQITDPVFTNNATVLGASLAESPVAGANANPAIIVQPGATLYAAGRDTSGTVVSAGRVFLFAPTVENGGSITVDGGGQVILGGGSDIYLGSSSDPALRGLLVEVDSGGVANAPSSVAVDASGSITVARGNITLIGLAVNQAGTLTATSALDANGSIELIARQASTSVNPDSALYPTGVGPGNPGDPSVLLAVGATGNVNIATGSKTVVSLDPTDTATAPLNDPTASALVSTIDIAGANVNIGGNGPGATLIQAHGGQVTVTARTASSQVLGGSAVSTYADGDGSVLGASDTTGNGTINVGANATIDVSGLKNVSVNGAQDFVYTELTSLNLADAPYQRTGLLLDQYVYLNLNNVPSWINVSSLQAAEAGTQAQRNTVGGSIALNAEGVVNLAKGSVLDVSGGSTYVTPATGRTTQLLTATGSVVDISNANANTQYVAFADQGSYTDLDTREGVDSTVSWQTPVYTQVGGYTQGANAGTVQIYATSASLAGTLLGNTTVGSTQRGTLPLGGQLRIGSQNAAQLDQEAGIQRPNILLAGSAQALAQGLSANLAANTSGPVIGLNTTALAQGGFTRLDLTSDGAIELAPGTPLDLGPRGVLTARANAIAVDSSISAPGGSISLSERPLTELPAGGGDASASDESAQRNALSLVPASSPLRGSVDVAAGTLLDTAGLWTNDTSVAPSSVPTAPVVLNGGSISISATSVDVSAASFDVSAGAWLTQQDAFSGGAGGALSISALSSAPAYFGAPAAPQLDLGNNFAARIAGYGVSKGGSLSLSAWSLQLGAGASSDPLAVDLAPDLGTRGFQTFQFNGYAQATVSAGTQFVPQVDYLPYSAALSTAPSGSSLRAVTAPIAALPGTLAPANIGIKSGEPGAGTVQLDPGSLIDAGATGSIALSGFTYVLDDGSLRAPGGSVALSLGNADQTGTSGSSGVSFTQATLNSRSIQLGADALIDVSGVTVAALQTNGLTTGSVLNAGSVALDAPLGTVAVFPGARILANGASATLDEPGAGGRYQPQVVNSAGGQVELSAGNALYLEGSISAGGGGKGANGGSLSVALYAVEPNTNDQDGNVITQLGAPTNLSITPNLPLLQPTQGPFALPTAQAAPFTVASGAQGAIAPGTINGSGFEQVWLQSADTITVAQSTNLGTRAPGANGPYALDSLVLSAQALVLAPGADLGLTAGYVALGPAAQQSAINSAGFSNYELAPPTGSAGTATLQVDAQQIDLVGNLALQGIGQATLSATGDIRGLGVQSGATPSRFTGTLSFGGNLSLSAAQLYPATQTDYGFSFAPAGTAADAGNGQVQLSIDPLAAAPLAPLSAGGTLSFNVNTFTSTGRVEAPQGAITITANAITLGKGSLLSVAGSGLVPYGEVYNGTSWTYGVPSGASIDNYTIGSSAGTTLPAKGINLNAPSGSLDAQAGSTIDVAGGGDVLGSGFIAGPGGSYDYSLNFPFGNTTRNPFFALIPSRGSSAAAYDPQIYSDLVLDTGLPSTGNATFAMGQTITIAAGSGIPAGIYTVLPARYALLPGAFAVEAVSGYADINPTSPQRQPDGTVVVAGKLGFAAAGTGASLWSAFRVYDRAQFDTLSEFESYYGSQFFATAAAEAGQVAQRLGPDAGALQLDAGAILLASTIEAAPAAGGRGAEIAIDVPQIVVGNPAAAADAPSTPQSSLQIDAGLLSQLDAQTLILGAIDTGSGRTIVLSNPVPTTSVSVQSTSSPLIAGQVLLSGASVSLGDGLGIIASRQQDPPTTAIEVTGDGAALYVGNVATPPSLTRSGASAPGTATIGDLSVAGRTLIEGNSVLFDATATQSYASGFALQANNLDLSATTLNLGAVPAGSTGLNLTPTLLETIGAARNLTISTVGGVDVYGSASLGQILPGGSPSLDSLTLIGPGISGFGTGTDQLTLAAGHVTLNSPTGSSISNAGTGTGTLAIDAAATTVDDGSITLAGSVAISGFSSVALTATGRVGAASQGGAQTVAGTGDLLFTGAVGTTPGLAVAGAGTSLSIDATRITAQRGVDATIAVPGALTISASGPAAAAEQTQLGASLSISAQNLTMGGRIDLPAGVVDITTTGPASTDGITLLSGASIRVAGLTQQFASTSADVSAGGISLTSANGSIVQSAGATLDIGGAGTAGDAGSLELSAANGTVALGGTLLAVPGSSAAGANFTVDAGSIASLSALVQTFNVATGTAGAGSIDVRARTGDLVVASTDTLKASSITLEADGGNGAGDGSITIGGTLDASGANGGRIALYANDQVLLQTGATLNASASGTSAGAGNGGQVLISSRIVANPAPTLDAIVLQSGSTIAVGGSGTGNGGSIVLRAPQVGNDVAITAATGAVLTGALNDAATTQTGINEEIVEAVHVYSAADNASIAANPNVSLDPTLPAGSLMATIQSDAQNYMAAGQAGIAARLSALGSFSLRPGVQIDTTGTITIASAGSSVLDFAATDSGTGAYLWRYGGSTLATSTPGALVLRAGGGIAVNESISDGFAATAAGAKLSSTVATAGDSWSYILTAGADLAAADPNRTGAAAADLTIGTASASNPVTVRTGTGTIALNASQDVLLDNGANQQGNVVYTAGVANVLAVDGSGNPLSFPVLTSTVNNARQTVDVVLTQYGGDLSIAAGRDVLGADPNLNSDGSTQDITEWLLRGGLATTAAPTVWFVDFAQFQQGFGALGGGNVSVNAGRNITEVGAVVASNGYDSGSGVSERNTGALTVNAGVSVVQGSVIQGLYYDQDGAFRLGAANFISNPNSDQYGSIRLAQGGNDLILQARETAEFDPSFNPTIAEPALINVGNSANRNKNAPASWQTQFLTYDSNSTLDARVAAGNLTLDTLANGNPDTQVPDIALNNYHIAPPNLLLTAFGGSLSGSNVILGTVPDSTGATIMMAPSATGQLSLLADGSITSLSVLMSQADPSVLPLAASPSANNDLTQGSLQTYYQGSGGASLHASDPTSAEVVARTGSIDGIYLDIPKTTEVAAGGQIGGNPNQLTIIDLQNSNAASLSTVSSGQGMSFVQGNEFEGITIDGPGALQVIAGGAINLGSGGLGIVSRGNLDDPNLSPVGASLVVAAGAGVGSNGLAATPDYAGVITNFVQYDAFASTGTAASALNQQVVAQLAKDPSLAPLVAALSAGLADRSSVGNPQSTFNQDLAQLSPAQLALGGVKLASAIQVINNQLFVASNNSDTFAPAYVAFGDLFPALNNDNQALRQFVLNNVFANASDGSTLQAQALQGLPPALASVIALGLAAPASVNQAGSAFSKALAALSPSVLESGMRQLMANVLAVAGTSEEQLAASGRLTGSGSPYAKQLTAFAQAYAPSTPAGLNDIQMDYNELKVEQTGSLAFFAPQGAVIVGQASPPTFTQSKIPSQLGIFTYGGGDIIGMARDSVDVYQSRVFTVAGGDIDLWSSLANLDAGRGPRDVAVVPPPQLIVDSNGVEQLDLSSTVTGSGIGALVTQANQPPSNINLMAPAGYVDAGEAGIRAQSGTVTLGTNLVLNAGNIQAASGVSGGAVVATPPPPLPPSTGTSAGDRVVEEAQREALAQQQQAAVAASQRPMRIVGEFIGFDNCAGASKDDEDCAGDNGKGDNGKGDKKGERSDAPAPGTR